MVLVLTDHINNEELIQNKPLSVIRRVSLSVAAIML